MQTLPPKPNINHKDFKKIIFNSFFPPQILNNENIKEEFRINKENNCDNSKSEMKYSLDSTDSISKLKLSSQILSLSCEKNSEEKAFIYPTEEKNIKITGKRKFLDFIDENQTKQNVSRNDLNRMIKFYPNASSHQELLYPKRMTEEKERTSINSLEKTKIPKESINELVRNKKIKHSNTTEDFCEKFYSFESPQNRNDQYKGSPSFFSFIRKEEIFKKQKL